MADQNQAAEHNYLEMSDEEVMKMGAPAPAAPPVETPEPTTAPAPSPAPQPEPEEEDEDLPADPVDPKDGDEDDEPAGTAGEEGVAPADKEVKDATPAAVKPGEEKPVTEVVPADQVTVDYEAEYKKLLAPFKANGREIQVKSVDDALSLMQMGANYNKKMAGLKPAMKLLKMLENNGLMSEEKIGWLIDLDKKDPNAINKLVKDSGLNPMDLDAEKAGDYRPKTHTVDDREIALDTVLDEIQETPTYNRTLAIVSKEWDGPSKQIVSEQPELLKVINDHVQRGIYDLIHAEVESERMLGRLTGLSDIAAYRQVGDAINARGGFNHLGSSQGKPATPPVVVTPAPKTAAEDERDKKRRAASSSRTAAPATNAAAFNPLSMSDDEFLKLAVPKF